MSGLGDVGPASSRSADGIHGAGGIGGLLALDTTVSTECSGRWPAGSARSSRQGLAAQNSRSGSAKNYWFLYDANGNVGQVLDATNVNSITTAAKYEDDPYGNTLAATGTYAAANPFRFSTKWFDAETGLSYYGYRYYNARPGRWMSRDPIEEEGGPQLYLPMGNDLVDLHDPHGLAAAHGSKPCTLCDGPPADDCLKKLLDRYHCPALTFKCCGSNDTSDPDCSFCDAHPDTHGFHRGNKIVFCRGNSTGPWDKTMTHELYHHMGDCWANKTHKKGKTECRDYVRDEFRAYYCDGGCASKADKKQCAFDGMKRSIADVPACKGQTDAQLWAMINVTTRGDAYRTTYCEFCTYPPPPSTQPTLLPQPKYPNLQPY